jgi:outer membrane receptor protein involved in Fe transport
MLLWGINMKLKSINYLILSSFVAFTSIAYAADEDEDDDRRSSGIEEITVTAEKRTSTVSDTSMSITAFDSSLLEDLGMQGPDDLMDQLPATTRDAYDVRIRGVGRNFRALGGDPGVATYYNGIYSPDFGIAASENYYYDVERVEVLRGPQGTLYGRNSIGGAINYITKAPKFDSEGEVRTVIGDDGMQQYYMMSSGPITDSLAYRVTVADIERDGDQISVGAGPDTNSLNDENYVLTLLWNINDNMSLQVRANDRESDRIIPSSILMTEGYGSNRGTRNRTDAVYGLRPAVATTPGAIAFTHPITGEVAYGAARRPGVDITGFPYRLNPGYGQSGPDVIGTFGSNVNSDSNCSYPYDNCASNHTKFVQNGQQTRFEWDVNDRTTFTYLYGYVDYNYDFNIDLDHSRSEMSQYRTTVREDTHMVTHEVNVNWMIGDDVEVTSGVFFMEENRKQNYALHNNVPGVLNAANYGLLDADLAGLYPYGLIFGAPGATIMGYLGWPSDAATPHVRLGEAPLGSTISGRWQGDSSGAVYRHTNDIQNDAMAYFTQATWTINDQFALVLGARYAEDEKTALEIRGGYTELYANALGGYLPGLNLLGGNPYIPISGDATIGAQTNVAMGNASWNYDPAMIAYLSGLAAAGVVNANVIYPGSIDPAAPITPTCALGALDCATPLRTGQGIPYSYTSTIGGTDIWDDTNVRVNVDYTPNDTQLWYLSYTTGFRAGGYALGVSGQRDDARDANGVPNGTGSVLVSYDEETVDAVELGYKGLHLDDTLQIFASIYHYDYDGYQDEMQQFDPIRGAGSNFVSNADGITNEGFEIEFQYQANDRLNIAGNFSHTETEYGEDYYVLTIDDPEIPVPVFGQCTQGYVGCSTDSLAFVQDYMVNLKGGPLKGIPETKFTLRATYEIDTRMGPVWLLVNHSYTGEFSASGVQRVLDTVPSREISNVSASWWNDEGDLSVRLYLNNMFNNHSIYSLGVNSDEQNYTKTGSALSPRHYGVDIRYKF